jgi:GTP-binding protein
MINDSPFAGKEGEFSTSRQIKERLNKELETDVALKVEDSGDGKWIVSGRGELHLSILIERMRREGYEFQVSRPKVITREINGEQVTPFEKVFIEVPEKYHGAVISKMGSRKGEMVEMRKENGIVYLEFIIPTRGFLGYKSEFLTDAKGLGIMNAAFYEYKKDPGNWQERNVQSRGVLFFGPAVIVYEGQVVGQNSREKDIRVNVCKTKQLSNMRSRGDGTSEHFNTPKTMDLEDALEYIGDDELVEITPKNIRIRKLHLKEIDEKRAGRENK